LQQPPVLAFAAMFYATPAQVVFSFARAVGMLPLTGTSNAEHMKEDLAGSKLALPPEVVQAIESIAG
jgi:diketogulonate reductase-like aldo/keto reductase